MGASLPGTLTASWLACPFPRPQVSGRSWAGSHFADGAVRNLPSVTQVEGTACKDEVICECFPLFAVPSGTYFQTCRDSPPPRLRGMAGAGKWTVELASRSESACRMRGNERSLRENAWLFTVFIRREHRTLYCGNIEITTAWGAFPVKYLLGRTGMPHGTERVAGTSA